jgi:hypothetical protein
VNCVVKAWLKRDCRVITATLGAAGERVARRVVVVASPPPRKKAKVAAVLTLLGYDA